MWVIWTPSTLGVSRQDRFEANGRSSSRKDNHKYESIAYFYCTRGEPARPDLVVIFRTIVKQLAVPCLGLPELVLSLFKGRKDQDSVQPLPLEESHELIMLLVSIHPKITIVIDALITADGGSFSTPWNTLFLLRKDC